MNEGWASYWHEKLFLNDDRIKGHEIDFARINAGITAMPNVGLNPYALGMRLFFYIEEMVNKGQYSIEFRRIADSITRDNYDKQTNKGLEFIFKIRENYNDFTIINSFVTQDFVTKNNLFVTGKRLNKERMVWEYYIKSRSVKDYKDMLFNSLYHPPYIEVKKGSDDPNALYLYHHFEGKPLVKEFINNTMLGIEYLWGGPVQLETSEVESVSPPATDSSGNLSTPPGKNKDPDIKWKRVIYTMKERKLTKKII